MTPVALGVFRGEPPFLPAPSLCPRKCGGPGQELPPCARRITSGKDLLTCSSPLTQVTTSNLLWAGRQPGRGSGRQAGPEAGAAIRVWLGSQVRASTGGRGPRETARGAPQPPDLGKGLFPGLLD